ncbi:hypothetical protein FHG87_011704 [Trinorchestia longiramus]|nr:hypothetical protein FHG87_011704 [Trinorchestia longiramus]
MERQQTSTNQKSHAGEISGNLMEHIAASKKQRVVQYNSLVDQGIADPELLERLTGLKPPARRHNGNRAPQRDAANHAQATGAVTATASSYASLAAPQSHFTGPPIPSRHPGPTGATSVVTSRDEEAPATQAPPRSVEVVTIGEESSRLSASSPAHLQQNTVSSLPNPAGDNDAEAVEDDDVIPGGFFRDGDDAAVGAGAEVVSTLGAAAATMPAPSPVPHFADDTMQLPGADKPPIKKMRVCQVYFGSRTHKQIEQVVRELKRTAYADARRVSVSCRHTASGSSCWLTGQVSPKSGRGLRRWAWLPHGPSRSVARHRHLRMRATVAPGC